MNSQLSITPVLEDLMPPSGLCGRDTHIVHIQIRRQTTHTHEINKSLKLFKDSVSVDGTHFEMQLGRLQDCIIVHVKVHSLEPGKC